MDCTFRIKEMYPLSQCCVTDRERGHKARKARTVLLKSPLDDTRKMHYSTARPSLFKVVFPRNRKEAGGNVIPTKMAKLSVEVGRKTHVELP